MKEKKGIILKGIGGFYYVESEYKIYECKARGLFRQKNLKPLPGDKVNFKIEDNSCTITEILNRKNSLIRPSVANIDNLFIVSSICNPTANTLIIDKMIALANSCNIYPILIISKSDLQDVTWLKSIYDKAKIKNIVFSTITGKGEKEIKESLSGKINVFTGNSGVGKSSLLNFLFKNLNLDTGIISKKLGRGRHTTRTVELFKVNKNSYVVDTPGFSTLDMNYYNTINEENLQHCFNEFNEYIGSCRFSSCTHICEKGCAVINAVKENKISKSRFDNYVCMYNELKGIKKW